MPNTPQPGIKQPAALSRALRLPACISVLLLVSLQGAAQDWSFDVTPHVWIANIDLETPHHIA